MKRLVGLGLVLLMTLAACGGGKASTPASMTSLAQTVTAVGAIAPAGELIAAGGDTVTLAERWAGADQTVVVFYRGFF